MPAPTISRMARAEQLRPQVMVYSDANHRYWLDDFHFGHRAGEYYFERHGISAKPLFQDFESPGFDAVRSPVGMDNLSDLDRRAGHDECIRRNARATLPVVSYRKHAQCYSIVAVSLGNT